MIARAVTCANNIARNSLDDIYPHKKVTNMEATWSAITDEVSYHEFGRRKKTPKCSLIFWFIISFKVTLYSKYILAKSRDWIQLKIQVETKLDFQSLRALNSCCLQREKNKQNMYIISLYASKTTSEYQSKYTSIRKHEWNNGHLSIQERNWPTFTKRHWAPYSCRVKPRSQWYSNSDEPIISIMLFVSIHALQIRSK